MKKLLGIILLLIFSLPYLTFRVYADLAESQYQAKIIAVVKEEVVSEGEASGIVQELEVRFLEGPDTGIIKKIEHSSLNSANKKLYKENDIVYVLYTKHEVVGQGLVQQLIITDEVRQPGIYILVAILVLLVILIDKKKGFFSLLSLVITFVLLFGYTLPALLNGAEPISTVLITALFVIFFNFYLAHGFNKKTTIAVFGTAVTTVIVILLSLIFVEITKLTGFSTEEASLLSAIKGNLLDYKGLLLAAIIIATVGILDDITISQSSIAHELHLIAKDISTFELYKRTMEVGKDHIASLVNTLVLVYASSALPLLLLFLNSNTSFNLVLNSEIVAEPIVVTLLTSIGLIIAVPITTIIAALIYTKSK